MLFVSLFIKLLPAPICKVLYWSRSVSCIIILLLIIILKRWEAGRWRWGRGYRKAQLKKGVVR
jgi:hypothetical protein